MSREVKIENYLNAEGKLKVWPSRRKARLAVLEYLSAGFEPGRLYTEKEVNSILDSFHLFGDPALLRRYLFHEGFMDRAPDGSAYWLKDPPGG
jgi:hypothetical protein